MRQLEMARRRSVDKVRVHVFLDGRDTSPTGGIGYLSDLQKVLDAKGVGRVATVIGRYFPMDRDKRWERIRKGYDALTLGEGYRTGDYLVAVQES